MVAAEKDLEDIDGDPIGRLILCLDSHIVAVAVLAGRSPVGPRPDLNTPAAFYPFNLKAGCACSHSCAGHR